jgi:hypothetical protein
LPTYPIEVKYGHEQVCILQVREADAVLDVLSEIVLETGLKIANGVTVTHNGVSFNEQNWHTNLADNNIWEGATLTATTQPNTKEPGSVQVFCKTLTGKTITIDCTLNW